MSDRMTVAQLHALNRGARASRVSREGPIHKAIIELLDLSLPPDAIYHHSPNELDMAGPDAARQVAKARDLGTKPGWGDLEIIWRGGFYMLEVKADSSQSKAQKSIEADIKRAGGYYEIARSVTEAEAALRKWGMI